MPEATGGTTCGSAGPRMRDVRQNLVAVAGLSLIAGIAIGLMIPRPGPPTPPAGGQNIPATVDPSSAGRKMFSPIVLGDDYVRGKHLELVASLERQCRATGKDCQLAKAARAAVSAQR